MLKLLKYLLKRHSTSNIKMKGTKKIIAEEMGKEFSKVTAIVSQKKDLSSPHLE